MLRALRRRVATSAANLVASHQQFDASAASSQYYVSLLLPLALRPGMSILEVGCGLGRKTAMISSEVGRSGSVIAIDEDAEIINAAQSNQGRERWRIAGECSADSAIGSAGCRVRGDASIPIFRVVERFASADGRAIRLPFEDGAFEGVVVDRVLERLSCLPDQITLLTELARVTADGGSVVVGAVDEDLMSRSYTVDGSLALLSSSLEAAGLDVHVAGSSRLAEVAQQPAIVAERSVSLLTCAGRVR